MGEAAPQDAVFRLPQLVPPTAASRSLADPPGPTTARSADPAVARGPRRFAEFAIRANGRLQHLRLRRVDQLLAAAARPVVAQGRGLGRSPLTGDGPTAVAPYSATPNAAPTC